MQYMGSKRKIAKHIIPIMVSAANDAGITRWVEPFVGGGNLIDKVPDYFRREGYDINDHVIHALIDIRDNLDDLPLIIPEHTYKKMIGSEPCSVSSLARFVCSFGGKFEAGYARGFDKKGSPRNYWDESVRSAKKQSPLIQSVHFEKAGYRDLKLNDYLIYCDPPYQGTTGYKTGSFNHDEFFEWCREMATNNIVFVSEYQCPEDFTEVWSGEQKTNFSSTRKSATHNAVEKLFRV